MKAPVVASILLVILGGCRTPPAGAPSDLGGGFRREGDPGFTPQEQAIVAATRRHFEHSCGKRIDADYRVTRRADGYSVLVLEVHRYVGKQPMFTVGRDFGVDLKEDGTVTHVFHGE